MSVAWTTRAHDSFGGREASSPGERNESAQPRIAEEESAPQDRATASYTAGCNTRSSKACFNACEAPRMASVLRDKALTAVAYGLGAKDVRVVYEITRMNAGLK